MRSVRRDGVGASRWEGTVRGDRPDIAAVRGARDVAGPRNRDTAYEPGPDPAVNRPDPGLGA